MARVIHLPKGSKNHKAKLTESAIPKIQNLIKSNMKDSEIAQHFGVTRKAIYDIRTGKSWRHVDR